MYQNLGVVMAWKPIGQPTVRQQRGRWVVRLDGVDTVTGKHRPRQLGTYASRRTAQHAATSFAVSGDVGAARDTVGELVRGWAASRVDVSPKTRMQYEWAADHISAGIGALRLDQLAREDIATWLDDLAKGGVMSRRSISIFRMVLRAALDDAVETGQLRRSPAARVGMPTASPSRTLSERPRRGPPTSCGRSSRRAPIIAGRRRSASPRCTACGAASCSGCDGRRSTSAPVR